MEHHGFEIYRHMSLLREVNLQFGSMSSVGPCIAIVTESIKEEVAGLIAPLGLEIAIETMVDNEGPKSQLNITQRRDISSRLPDA